MTTSSIDPAVGSLVEAPPSGRLSIWQAGGLAVSSFIPAVGMATAPAWIVGYAGGGSWLVMLVTAVAMSCVGMAVITFARRYVASGALYSYIGEVFGPWARILMAASLAIGYIVGTATLLCGAGLFFGSFLVSNGIGWATAPIAQIVIYILATVVVAALAYRGLDASVRTCVILTAISVPVMAVITIATVRHTGLDLSTQFDLSGISFGPFSQGLAVAAAFLIMFESSAALAAETKDPRRVVPLVVMVVPIGLGALYVLTTICQVPGLLAVTDQLAAGVSPPAALAAASGLGFFANTADLFIAVAIFASLIGVYNYGSRVLTTLAEDGLLPTALTRHHPRYKTPTVSIVIVAVFSTLLPIVLLIVAGGSPMAVYGYAATLLAYFWVPPYLLVCIGAVVLLRREKRPLAGIIIAAVVGVALTAWILLNAFVYPAASPLNVLPWVFLATLALGVAVFTVSYRNSRGRIAAAAASENP